MTVRRVNVEQRVQQWTHECVTHYVHVVAARFKYLFVVVVVFNCLFW